MMTKKNNKLNKCTLECIELSCMELSLKLEGEKTFVEFLGLQGPNKKHFQYLFSFMEKHLAVFCSKV